MDEDLVISVQLPLIELAMCAAESTPTKCYNKSTNEMMKKLKSELIFYENRLGSCPCGATLLILVALPMFFFTSCSPPHFLYYYSYFCFVTCVHCSWISFGKTIRLITILSSSSKVLFASGWLVYNLFESIWRCRKYLNVCLSASYLCCYTKKARRR